MSDLKPLVVTTAHRGVFFGYGTPELGAKNIKLEKCQMVVYWTSECKGLLGLVANGPQNGCRIGPAVKGVLLSDVTAVMEVEPSVAKKFEVFQW